MEQTKEETCETTQELEKVEKQLEKDPDCQNLRQKAKALRQKIRAKSKGAADDFKKFAFKGNIIDLAIAVVIGGAFGAIVTSLVKDIIMPLLSMVTGTVHFASWSIYGINYGLFIQTILDFFVIALSIYAIFKIVVFFRKRAEKRRLANALPPPPPVLTKTEQLLTDIKDLLEKEKGA
jgi:large conductance mechanosensitive channel